MDLFTQILFGNHKGINILSLNWDYLIILDACRCDVFKYMYRMFLSRNTKFNCVLSPGSSTMEFIRRTLSSNCTENNFKDTIFVNANPVIDQVLGDRISKIFYKYIPVWRRYWNETIGTVLPEDVYRVTLKVFIRYPDKRIIIWFLQPHYPYIDKKFNYINVLGKDFMDNAHRHGLFSSNLLTFLRIMKKLIRKRYLCAGIPEKLCEYLHQIPSEVIKAYAVNLFYVFQFVKKLVEVLPGKIVIAADHGEAFGEPLHKLIPVPVYGHPSRVRIPSLTQVPYVVLQNNITQDNATKKVIKELFNSYKKIDIKLRRKYRKF